MNLKPCAAAPSVNVPRLAPMSSSTGRGRPAAPAAAAVAPRRPKTSAPRPRSQAPESMMLLLTMSPSLPAVARVNRTTFYCRRAFSCLGFISLVMFHLSVLRSCVRRRPLQWPQR